MLKVERVVVLGAAIAAHLSNAGLSTSLLYIFKDNKQKLIYSF